MREISYKLWTGKKFIAVGSIEFFTDESIHVNGEFPIGDKDFPTEYKLVEYTGLKDNHGKNIYEGDVIGRRGFFNRVILHNGINMEEYSINNPEQRRLLIKYSFDEHDEIIGNIYENPELLK